MEEDENRKDSKCPKSEMKGAGCALTSKVGSKTRHVARKCWQLPAGMRTTKPKASGQLDGWGEPVHREAVGLHGGGWAPASGSCGAGRGSRAHENGHEQGRVLLLEYAGTFRMRENAKNIVFEEVKV